MNNMNNINNMNNNYRQNTQNTKNIQIQCQTPLNTTNNYYSQNNNGNYFIPNTNYNQNNMHFYNSQLEQKKENKNKKRTIIIILVVFLILVFCCGCCVWLYLIGENNSEEYLVNNYSEIVGQSFYNIEIDDENLEFNEDYTFVWQSEDSILEGSYEIYYDNEAIDYIVEKLPDYGVTREEQEDFLERTDDYDHYVCFVLFPNSLIVGDEEVKPSAKIPYFGFSIYENGNYYLDVANMNSFGYTTLCRK